MKKSLLTAAMMLLPAFAASAGQDGAMKAVVATIAAVLLVQLLAAVAFVYSGMFNVAASDPHWSMTHAVMETARVRSIKAHAAAITAPDGLADHKRIVAGTSHF